MNPCVWQLALTDGHYRVYLRMNGKEQFCNRIASFRCQTVMTIGSRSGVRLTVEHICLAFVDIRRDTYVNGFVDSQDQGHDTVTTVVGNECVGIGASFGIAYAVEQVVCSFAHRMTNSIMDNRYHAYVAYVRTII